MTAADPKPREPRPFNGFLAEQRRGLTHAELSERLSELVNACIEHGKVGALTLTLKVRPTGDMVEITDSIRVKVPEGERSASLFFVTADGVSRQNPNQPELPLRDALARREVSQ